MALVVAHRGASGAHPPGNTLEAFAAAAEMGADLVELDVHATADGALAVHHDHELPDGRPLDLVRAADLPTWVPLLDAALDACGAVGVNVEIKPDGPESLREAMVDSTIECIRRRVDVTSFLVTSFEWAIVVQVRTAAPEIPTGFLTMGGSDLRELLGRIAAAGHVAVNPWDGIVTAALVDAAHAEGLSVNVWTVDDPARIVELDRFGVDAIITNHPDRCRASLSRG